MEANGLHPHRKQGNPISPAETVSVFCENLQGWQNLSETILTAYCIYRVFINFISDTKLTNHSGGQHRLNVLKTGMVWEKDA